MSRSTLAIGMVPTTGLAFALTLKARKAAAVLGKLGGKAKSEKKAESSRKNGKLGGRPKKKPE